MRPFQELALWQRGFVDRYLAVNPKKALLIAAPGTGKTLTSAVVADELLKRGDCDSLVVLTDMVALRDQWAHVARDQGIEISSGDFSHQGAALTIQSLRNEQSFSRVRELLQRRRPIIIVDEAHRLTRAGVLVDQLIGRGRALYIGTTDQVIGFDGYAYSFALGELTPPKVEKSAFALPFSPSFELIQRLIRGRATLEELSWRAFEKLIADLLEADGYDIELMRGTKDGGVDVIATLDLGAAGCIKSLWQAKKYSKNKVGLSAVRELADTRAEHKASKAILVTSTFLTKGALDRIERESFLLGKVDRNDLNKWLMRYAKGAWTPDLFGDAKE